MRIERPDYHEMAAKVMSGRSPGWDVLIDEWFHNNVEPMNKMLSEGVEVYGEDNCSGNIWAQECQLTNHKLKALLINIQPIKKETAEDVLRDWIKFTDRSTHPTGDQWKIRERAKAVLSDA